MKSAMGTVQEERSAGPQESSAAGRKLTPSMTTGNVVKDLDRIQEQHVRYATKLETEDKKGKSLDKSIRVSPRM